MSNNDRHYFDCTASFIDNVLKNSKSSDRFLESLEEHIDMGYELTNFSDSKEKMYELDMLFFREKSNRREILVS